jgi:hypothetical protein
MVVQDGLSLHLSYFNCFTERLHFIHFYKILNYSNTLVESSRIRQKVDAWCCHCRRGGPPEGWRDRPAAPSRGSQAWVVGSRSLNYQQLYPRTNTRTHELFSTFFCSQEDAAGLQLHRRSSPRQQQDTHLTRLTHQIEAHSTAWRIRT